MSGIGPPPAAVPAWLDLMRPQRGEIRIMTSAIASVRPRSGQHCTVHLVDGTVISVTEDYPFVCRLMEGQDPNAVTG